jgi:hypothetical protein
MRKSICLVTGLLLLGLTFFQLQAATSTLLTITKTTTLTNKDATNFSNKFGNTLSNPLLSFQCNTGSCKVIATVAGFAGSLAKQLLNGRVEAKFTSSDNKFILECGKIPVSYCNVIQKNAVLP